MTDQTSLNGSSHGSGGLGHCPFAGRRRDETLHDFLLRRHDEMSIEITGLQARITRQTLTLSIEREQSSLAEDRLLFGQTGLAALAAGICWTCAPEDWLTLVLGVTVASLVGGIVILRLPVLLADASDCIRRWRGK